LESVRSAAAAAWPRRYRRYWEGSLDRLATWLDEEKKRKTDDQRKD
jgi:hypothetical protein